MEAFWGLSLVQWTAIIAVASIALAGIYIVIALIMRDTAKRQLRAYISIEHASLRTEENAIITEITFKNFGQTPAYKVRTVTLVGICNYPWNPAIKTPSPSLEMGTVGPHVGFSVPENSTAITLSQRAQVAGGTHAIWVFGRIEYVDAFRIDQFTNFRMCHRSAFKPGVRLLLGPDTGDNEAS